MSHHNSHSPQDINTLRSPTPFEIVCALVEARLLIEAYEAGEPPPEFEDGWKDDLEAQFDPDAPLPLTLIERSAVEYRAERKRRENGRG